ncbi:hypothetical protein [Halobacteriovorax sp. ZH4_bin.1]|uniref:hypothetical protein n=1 Tax=unclassified Halobacteriovorax TaxID=2639665 RepID=UPI003716B2AA
MRKSTLMIALFAAIFSIQSYSCDIHGKTGIMPENDLYRGVDALTGNGMTEELFNIIIDRANEVYAPVVETEGATLKFHRKWEDGTVNAYANQGGGVWNVHMFGGLARHELVTPDGFALVVCHELGHHLAGAPKIKRFWIPSWASNEGQSDYWASLKCFRRIFQDDDNARIVSKMDIDPEVESKCNAVWSDSNENALCKRMAQAAKGLATLLNSGRSVSFTTPDMSVVRKTDDKHPAGQCRLDTYFQGALCDKDLNDDVSKTDALAGTCNRIDDYETGIRPLCWYKPKRM